MPRRRASRPRCSSGWDNCIIERGDTRLGLPFSSPQSGSNTSFTMTRATYAGAMDALAKLKEIAAATLGGAADDYDVENETVFAKADRSRSMTYAAAAQRAIELGGRYSGPRGARGHQRRDEAPASRRSRAPA